MCIRDSVNKALEKEKAKYAAQADEASIRRIAKEEANLKEYKAKLAAATEPRRIEGYTKTVRDQEKYIADLKKLQAKEK